MAVFALTDRLINSIGWTLLGLEIMNVAADAFVDGYQSNGALNLAFSALITAAFTERSLRPKNNGSEKVAPDDDRNVVGPVPRNPPGDPVGNSVARGPRPPLTRAERALIALTLVVTVLGALYFWDRGKDDRAADAGQTATIERLDKLAKENAGLIRKLDTALSCIDKASGVAAENLRRRSAPSSVATEATRKLISAFGKLSEATTPEQQAANRAISSQLFSDFDRAQADADAARDANPLLPFPNCKPDDGDSMEPSDINTDQG